MLTGVLPFPGHDLHHVLERIQTEATPDPSKLSPDIPQRLAAIVLHALEKESGKRYQSATEFAQALDDFLADLKKPTAPFAAMTPVGSLSPSPTTASSPPQEEIWCSACGERIYSKLSVPGRCTVCQSPICNRCWKVKMKRRCSGHTESDKPTARPADDSTPERGPAPQAHVGAPIEAQRERSMTASESIRVVARPMEERPAPSPVAAAPPDKLPEAEPSTEERLREKHQQALGKIAEARAEGRLAVSAYGAWLAEKSFLRMIESSLRLRNEFNDPCRGVTVPVKDWSKVRREVAVAPSLPACGTALSSVQESLIRHPFSARVIFDLRKRNFCGMLRGRVVIEVCNLAHVDRFVSEGFDDQPVSRADLEVLLNDTVMRAVASGSWHVLILASPTGWTSEARDFVTGKGPLPFRDRLVSVVAFEEETGRSLLDELDEKLWQFKEVFSSDLDGATLAEARKFIEEYLMLKDSIGLDALVSELGISQKAADRVFRILESTGPFTVATIQGMGQFLSKKN
jgi:hypothetical protein